MNGPQLTTGELIAELARELVATALVVALLIPALIIHVVSTFSAMLFRRIGGID